VKASYKSIRRRLNFYLASLCVLKGLVCWRKSEDGGGGWGVEPVSESKELGDIFLSSPEKAAVECGSISRRQERETKTATSEEEQ